MATRERSRGPTKNDVAIRKIAHQHERDIRIVWGVTFVVAIAASAVPIWALHFAIQPLAGEKTEILATVPLSIGIVISAVMNLFQLIVARFRRRELERLRKRSDDIEAGTLRTSEGTV